MHLKKQFFCTFLMLFLMAASIQAQNFQISFTGSGLSTTVDSVQVTNIAKGTSITVKTSEVLHLVGTPTGMENNLAGESNLRIFPNPMTESSGIEFFNFSECPAQIEVLDITGKMVIRYKQHLLQGNHRFEISGLNPGIYMVNVHTGESRYSGKLVSHGEHSVLPAIRYQGNMYPPAQKSVLKSTADLVQMSYSAGERLLLKGLSGNYARVLTLIPSQNQTVNFEFIACTDAGGKHYPVVTIGTQTWMAENLAYLPSVVGPGTGSFTTSYHYVYGYNGTSISEAKAATNYLTYGVLYNWPAALQFCPTGWHLPTDTEWTTLENYLITNGYNYDGTTTWNLIAKSLATSGGWASSGGTGMVGNNDYPEKRNATGFSALPGGSRYADGSFYQAGSYGVWWSATEYSSFYTYRRNLGYGGSDLGRYYSLQDSGLSVRCLKD